MRPLDFGIRRHPIYSDDSEYGWACEVEGCRRDPLSEAEYKPDRDPQRYCRSHPGKKISRRVRLRD